MRRKILMSLGAPLLALGMLALQGCYGLAPGYGYGGGYGPRAYSGIGLGPSYAYGGGHPVYEPALWGGNGGWGGGHDWNHGFYADRGLNHGVYGGAQAFAGGHNVGGNARAGGRSFGGGRSVGGNGRASAAHAGGGHGGGGHESGHGRG